MIRLLRLAAFIEGISYLLLLFFAMPMKYLYNTPVYVKHIGMAHGILFVLLIVLISLTSQKIPNKLATRLFVASLIPFGTFFTDKALRKSY